MGPEGNFGPPLRDLKLPLGPSLRGRVPGRGRARRRMRARRGLRGQRGQPGRRDLRAGRTRETRGPRTRRTREAGGPGTREDPGGGRTREGGRTGRPEDPGDGRTGRPEDPGDGRTGDAEDREAGETCEAGGDGGAGPGRSGMEAKVTSPILLHGESYLCPPAGRPLPVARTPPRGAAPGAPHSRAQPAAARPPPQLRLSRRRSSRPASRLCGPTGRPGTVPPGPGPLRGPMRHARTVPARPHTPSRSRTSRRCYSRPPLRPSAAPRVTPVPPTASPGPQPQPHASPQRAPRRIHLAPTACPLCLRHPYASSTACARPRTSPQVPRVPPDQPVPRRLTSP